MANLELIDTLTGEATEPVLASEVIDSDVHPVFPGSAAEIMPWLPAGWKRRLEGRVFNAPVGFFSGPPQNFLRPEATPPDGGAPGSDAAFMAKDLLDRWGVCAAILTPHPNKMNSWLDPDEGREVASAVNRFFDERWLAVDKRFRLNMVVAPQDPDAAAAEIRAFGQHKSVVGVYLTLLNMMMGERYYYPIYEAATEMGLPIVFHGNGLDGMYQGLPTFASGVPKSYTERFVLVPQLIESHISSLVFSGAFERYPDLKVVFLEAGWAHIPHLLWRMDSMWKAARADRPWVRIAPSEYVRQHIRFSTQPSYEAPKREMVHKVMEMIYPESTLLFSSDYPHWDTDDLDVTRRQLTGLPLELQRRILSGNARDTFARL
jgi:uncharacterized protein